MLQFGQSGQLGQKVSLPFRCGVNLMVLKSVQKSALEYEKESFIPFLQNNFSLDQ